MKKLLLLAALSLVGCATTEHPTELEAFEIRVSTLRGDIYTMQQQNRQMQYFIDHDKCFISYAICLGEKKVVQKVCWKHHEDCVVAVYHQWKGDE